MIMIMTYEERVSTTAVSVGLILGGAARAVVGRSRRLAAGSIPALAICAADSSAEGSEVSSIMKEFKIHSPFLWNKKNGILVHTLRRLSVISTLSAIIVLVQTGRLCD
jgi:hypothetical protein